MENLLEITLKGNEKHLSQLFSYSKKRKKANLSSLQDYMAHVFNQTLVRDQIYGAWAQVLLKEDKYVLKIYSPHHDLSEYKDLIGSYMKAGKMALSIFKDNKKEIKKAGKNSMKFLLPFGLSMKKTKSVQLLHFPPLETFVYQDYLYSPTNRRWENLLGYNGMTEAFFPELESIVDCVPIAAPGDDSKGIEPFNNYFTPYVKEMLRARLKQEGDYTQPVVAYGGPVRDWLEKSFPKESNGHLEPLSLLTLQLFDSGVKTPVLCANHPSKYLYYTDDDKPSDYATKKEIMTQDLIAAGWQSRMAYGSKVKSTQVLEKMKKHWTGNPRVEEIMRQEDKAYGYTL